MIPVYVIVILILIIVYFVLVWVNNALLFFPMRADGINEERFYQNAKDGFKKAGFDVDIESGFIQSSSECKVHFVHVKNKNTALNGRLSIFAHGNAGNVFNRLLVRGYVVDLLLKHGSVMLFDYRGYGLSTGGSPSEKGVKDDMLNVWNYCIGLGYEPKNTIVYGESLGTAIVSALVEHLSRKNKPLPKGIVLQSGFFSLKRIASDIYSPILGIFLLNDFDNDTYTGKILSKNPNYPILFLHSKEDELISYQHSKDLADKHNCTLQAIGGSHGVPRFDDETHAHLERIFKC